MLFGWAKEEVRKDTKILADKTMVSPISAFLIVFLADSSESGFPVEVIYKYPPLTRKKVDTRDAITVIVLKALSVN